MRKSLKSCIFFLFISILNILWIYGLTDGRPFIRMPHGNIDKSFYDICSYIISFSIFLFVAIYAYYQYGKNNIIKILYSYIFICISIVFVIFMYVVAPNIESGHSYVIYEKILLLVMYLSFIIYIYSCFSGFIISLLTQHDTNNKKINKKIYVTIHISTTILIICTNYFFNK